MFSCFWNRTWKFQYHYGSRDVNTFLDKNKRYTKCSATVGATWHLPIHIASNIEPYLKQWTSSPVFHMKRKCLVSKVIARQYFHQCFTATSCTQTLASWAYSITQLILVACCILYCISIYNLIKEFSGEVGRFDKAKCCCSVSQRRAHRSFAGFTRTKQTLAPSGHPWLFHFPHACSSCVSPCEYVHPTVPMWMCGSASALD